MCARALPGVDRPATVLVAFGEESHSWITPRLIVIAECSRARGRAVLRGGCARRIHEGERKDSGTTAGRECGRSGPCSELRSKCDCDRGGAERAQKGGEQNGCRHRERRRLVEACRYL